MLPTEEYVRAIADEIGLRDWRIHVDSSDEMESLGQCRTVGQRRIAYLTFVNHDDAEELRDTVLHELLHIILNPLFLPIENVKSTLGEPLYNATYNSHIDHLERAVDTLSASLAPLFPLPDGKPSPDIRLIVDNTREEAS